MADRDLRLLERDARYDPLAAERLRAERRRAGVRPPVGATVRVVRYGNGSETSKAAEKWIVGQVGTVVERETLIDFVGVKLPTEAKSKLFYPDELEEIDPPGPHVDPDPTMPPTPAAELGGGA